MPGLIALISENKCPTDEPESEGRWISSCAFLRFAASKVDWDEKLFLTAIRLPRDTKRLDRGMMTGLVGKTV